MRLFVAVNIPEELKEGISAHQEKLKDTLPGVRWVAADKMHITLKFIGEMPEESVPEICSALGKSVSGFKPFDVSVAAGGIFPDPSHPRVLWAEVAEGRQELGRLAAAVDAALEKLEIKPEQRPFSPHLTLGRLHSAVDPASLAGKSTRMESSALGRFTVRSVELMRSELNPKGAQYTCLRSVSV